MPQFPNATAVAVTGALAGASTYSEPTLAYSQLTDTSVTFNTNRIAYHQFLVGDRDKRTHVLGEDVVRAGVRESLQAIYQEVSSKAADVMYTTGSFLSGTGGSGVDYDLTITSTANLQLGMRKLVQGFDSQNVPNGPNDRWLILNGAANGLFQQWGSNQVFEATFGSTNDIISGQVYKYMGFNILFDNAVTAGKGIALAPSKFALCMPQDPIVQILPDSSQWGDFCRLRLYYGLGALGPTTNTYDGQAIAGGRQGILRITQT